jgi:hypothetical protein
VATRSLTVTVVEPTESLAEIKYFRASPAAIYPGDRSTLSWSVANAASVEIDNGIGGGKKVKDVFTVTPDLTTLYTLRVMDDKGNLRTAQTTVTVKPRPAAPPEEAPKLEEAPRDQIPSPR